MNPREAISAATRMVYRANYTESPENAQARIREANSLSVRRGCSLPDRARAEYYEMVAMGRVHLNQEIVLFSAIRLSRDRVVDVSARSMEAF